jgi:hypothetical protein
MYNILLVVIGLLTVVISALIIHKRYHALLSTIVNDAHAYVWVLFGFFLLLLGTYIKNIVTDGTIINFLLLGIIIVIERRLKDITDRLTETAEKLNDTNRKLDDIALNEAYLIQTNQKLQQLIDIF